MELNLQTMNDPKGKGSLQAKQVDQNKNNDGIHTMNNYKAAAPSSSTTSRQWSGFRNPRIVRVSRTFGGKDRHSKVSTVRGLRDRRIRLSVPTAVQLYDLQDRLGLSQPSKVIDWLLQVTDDDIEKLPPLQLLPHHGLLNTTSSHQILNSVPWFDVNRRLNEQGRLDDEKGKSINDRQDDDGICFYRSGSTVLGQKNNVPSTITGLLNNANYSQHYHHNSEPSSWSLSQFPSGLPQMDHMLSSSNNNVTMPSGSQLIFSPTMPTPVASVFGTYNDHHQPSMMQLLSSSSNNANSESFAPSDVLMPSLQYSIGSSTLRTSFPALDGLKFHSQSHDGSSSQQRKVDDNGRFRIGALIFDRKLETLTLGLVRLKAKEQESTRREGSMKIEKKVVNSELIEN